MTNPIVESLFDGLAQRRTPQQVAADLVRLGHDRLLPEQTARELRNLAAYTRYGYGTSMSTRYRRHPGLNRAYAAAQAAMAAVTTAAGLDPMPSADGQDPVSLRAFVQAANTVLGLSGDAAGNPPTRRPRARHKTRSYTFYDGTIETWSMRNGSRGRRGDSHGHADPRTAMTAQQRRVALPGVSVRAYRRAVATVNHLEQRTAVLAAERDRETAVAFGKGRLARTIDRAAFTGNEATACFVAYYVARLGMRTVFTNGAQDRPMDTIAEDLLKVALGHPGCRPAVIARVLTRRSVLARLTGAEKGELLGLYYEQLAACARALSGSFDYHRDRTRMVARPGDDSSTWNAASRAFNQARTGWLNLLADLGMADVVEAMCPGKVPALVAADVAHWHLASGGTQHTDVAVFAELPLPWEVVTGQVTCTADQVRQVCARHGVDSDESGWTQAYRQDDLEVAAPALDLVHGCAVVSPVLATLLRKAGVAAGRAELESVQFPGYGAVGRVPDAVG